MLTIIDPTPSLARSLNNLQISDPPGNAYRQPNQYTFTGRGASLDNARLPYIGHSAAAGQSPMESLDPGYKVHERGFWKTGRVFKVLWPEPVGSANYAHSHDSYQASFDKRVVVKIRWFVVVRHCERHSLCLPIMTYASMGVAKAGIIKSNHAIIYSAKAAPEPTPNERPRRGEPGMLQSIQVRSNTRTDALDTMSRVNFAKIYTVEHNVKVISFGMVSHRSIAQFLANFKQVREAQDQLIECEDSGELREEEDDQRAGVEDAQGKTVHEPSTNARLRYTINHYIDSLRNSGNPEAQQIANHIQQASVGHQLEFLRRYTDADPG